jgi:hypothetical protein
MKQITNLLYSYKLQLISLVLGGTAGYAFYYFIGCNSGHCMITGNPFVSTIYGMVLGLVWTWPNKARKAKK